MKDVYRISGNSDKESLTNLMNLAQIVKLKQFNIKVFNISASIKLLSPLQCVQKINTFLI